MAIPEFLSHLQDCVNQSRRELHRLSWGQVCLDLSLQPELARLFLPALPPTVAGIGEGKVKAWCGWPQPHWPWSWRDYGPRSMVPAYCDGDTVTVHQVDEDLLSVVQGDQAFYWAPGGQTLPYYELGSPLRVAMAHLLARQGLWMVHAACLGLGGQGLLLAGKGGSGKSTLASLALQQSWQYLSEDYTLVEMQPRPVAHRLYLTLKLHPRDGGLKQVHFLAPDQVQPCLNLVALVLPQIDESRQRAALEPARPGEALLALAPSTIFQLPGLGQSSLGAMARLARSLPVYRLWLGRDRVSALQALEQLL